MENIDNDPFSFSCSVQVKDAAAGALVEGHKVVHLITCGLWSAGRVYYHGL